VAALSHPFIGFVAIILALAIGAVVSAITCPDFGKM
jgi:hypothetical protein